MTRTTLMIGLLLAGPAWAECPSPKLCLQQGYEFKAATSVRLIVAGKQQVIDRVYLLRDKDLVACDKTAWPDGPPPNSTVMQGLWYCRGE